jgi:hypothetical protein
MKPNTKQEAQGAWTTVDGEMRFVPFEEFRTVYVEVTHVVPVRVVKSGQDDEPLVVSQDEAARLVAQDIQDMNWGGYSMLGKAFSKAGLSAWDAVNIEMTARLGRKTMSTINQEKYDAMRARAAELGLK